MLMDRTFRIDPRRRRPGRRIVWRRIGVFSLAVMLATGSAVAAYAHYLRRRTPPRDECVLLLHGLYRTAASMALIEHHLIRQGYGVINIDYASTRSDIASVAQEEVTAAVAAAKEQGYERIHVVTHSLGALVIRSYLQDHRLPEGSRIVMLAPPNQGSELADWAYRTFPKLRRVAGPAANQLGTRGRPFASRLHPVSEAVGILIGEKSWNPLSSKILPGADDGAVPLERAKLQEMQDFMVVPCNHSSIILDKNVRYQIVRFLQRGRFDRQGNHK
jgi:pimeloyl-ACP methyl ester carboxylesterase